MKNRILITLLTVCILLTPLSVFAESETPAGSNIAYSDSLYEAGDVAVEPKLTFEYRPDEQAASPNAPEIGCEAAYVADPISGKVFYEKNAHEKRYPASTTKILTALLVLENCNVEEEAIVSQRAIDLMPEGYSNANLQPGETLSVYTLLQALLIPSANEAAYALAEHVSGSVEAFAKLCNQRAAELGCENLHFVNPNGVHDENHYCTAYDLYLIARECQQYPVFNEIVQSTGFTVPTTDIHPDNDRTYSTTNELLLPKNRYYCAYCTGIKTGHTTPAGECLVASSAKDNLNLICVVLGGKKGDGFNERFSDTTTLFAYVYDNYRYQQIADKSVPAKTVTIDNAVKETPTLDILPATDIYAVVPNTITADNADPSVALPAELKAPIQQGQVLGTVTYRVDGMVYATNLIAGNEIIKKPYWLYNTLIAAGALLLLIMLFFIIRSIQKRKA